MILEYVCVGHCVVVFLSGITQGSLVAVDYVGRCCDEVFSRRCVKRLSCHFLLPVTVRQCSK